MAWQESDLTLIETALTNGTRKVTFADGRSKEFHSPAELISVRREIKADLASQALAASPSNRTIVARFRR